MQNDQLRPATAGEISLYKTLDGRNVSAVNGISGKGKGWRPVCGGAYIGSTVYATEALAITGGKKFIKELEDRVLARNLTLLPPKAGDSQINTPIVKPTTKRPRKKRNTQGA